MRLYQIGVQPVQTRGDTMSDYTLTLSEEQVEHLARMCTLSATKLYHMPDGNEKAVGQALELRETIMRQKRRQKYE